MGDVRSTKGLRLYVPHAYAVHGLWGPGSSCASFGSRDRRVKVQHDIRCRVYSGCNLQRYGKGPAVRIGGVPRVGQFQERSPAGFGAEDERPLDLQSFITTWEYFNKILPQDGLWEAHVHPPERPRSLLVPSY